MNLETLVLELVADDSKLSRDIDAAVNSATKKLAEIESVGAINPNVNLKSLHELNKLLDVKQKHIKETAKVFTQTVVKAKTDVKELDGLGEKLNQTTEKAAQTKARVKKQVVTPSTNEKPLDSLNQKYTKTQSAHTKTRINLMGQTISTSVNMGSLIGLEEKYANIVKKHVKVGATLSSKGLKVNANVEEVENMIKSMTDLASKEFSANVKVKGTGSVENKQARSQAKEQAKTAVMVEILSQLLTLTREQVQKDKPGIIDALTYIPKTIGKASLEGYGYAYSSLFMNNALDEFDKASGLNFKKNVGGFAGRFAGSKTRQGIDKYNEYKGTDTMSSGADTFNKATQRAAQESQNLKDVVTETFASPTNDNLNKAASQLLETLEAISSVPTTPIELLVKATKELKADSVVEQVNERSSTLDEIAKKYGVADAKRIIIVSGGFAGQKGQGSNTVADEIRKVAKEGDVVIPIENVNTDVRAQAGDNPAMWFYDAVRIPATTGASGVNEDAITMAAMAQAARGQNPNAQIRFVGYSGGGFNAEEATRYSNAAGIDNVSGVGFGTPGLMARTQMDNFQGYIGEKDPLRLFVEQTGRAMGISRPNQPIKGVASHGLTDYLANANALSVIIGETVEQYNELIHVANAASNVNTPFSIDDIQAKVDGLSALREQIEAVLNQASVIIDVDAVQVATGSPRLLPPAKETQNQSVKIENPLGKNIQDVPSLNQQRTLQGRVIKSLPPSIEQKPKQNTTTQNITLADVQNRLQPMIKSQLVSLLNMTKEFNLSAKVFAMNMNKVNRFMLAPGKKLEDKTIDVAATPITERSQNALVQNAITSKLGVPNQGTKIDIPTNLNKPEMVLVEAMPIVPEVKKLKQSSVQSFAQSNQGLDSSYVKSIAVNMGAITKQVNAQEEVDSAIEYVSQISKKTKDFFAKIEETIKKGELDLAKAQLQTVLAVKTHARQDIEDIVNYLNDIGENTKVGSGTLGGTLQGAKGNWTRWEKKANKLMGQVNQKLLEQSPSTYFIDDKAIRKNMLAAKKGMVAGGESGRDAGDAFGKLMSTVNKLKGVDLNSLGEDAIEGYRKGLLNKEGQLDSTVIMLAKSLPDEVRRILKIQSPSKVMMKLGDDAILGFIVGMDGRIKSIEKLTLPIPELEKQGWTELEEYRDIINSMKLGKDAANWKAEDYADEDNFDFLTLNPDQYEVGEKLLYSDDTVKWSAIQKQFQKQQKASSANSQIPDPWGMNDTSKVVNESVKKQVETAKKVNQQVEQKKQEIRKQSENKQVQDAVESAKRVSESVANQVNQFVDESTTNNIPNPTQNTNTEIPNNTQSNESDDAVLIGKNIAKNIGYGIIGGSSYIYGAIQEIVKRANKFLGEMEISGGEKVRQGIADNIVGFAESRVDDAIDFVDSGTNVVSNIRNGGNSDSSMPDDVVDVIDRVRNSSDPARRAVSDLGNSFNELRTEFGGLVSENPKLQFFGELLGNIKEGLIGFIGLSAISAVLGDFVKQSYQAALAAERFVNGLSFSNTQNPTATLKEIYEYSNKIGSSFTAASDGYKRLITASYLNPIQSSIPDVFEGTQALMSSVGLTGEQQSNVYLAMSQVIGKNRLQAEELQGQIAEALPQAPGIVARSMGKSEMELRRMMQQGNLSAMEVLPKFAAQANIESTVPLLTTAQSTNAEITRLANNMERLKQTTGAVMVGFKAPIQLVNALLRLLNENGQFLIYTVGMLSAILAIKLVAAIASVAVQTKVGSLALKTFNGALMSTGKAIAPVVAITAIFTTFFRIVNAGNEELKEMVKQTNEVIKAIDAKDIEKGFVEKMGDSFKKAINPTTWLDFNQIVKTKDKDGNEQLTSMTLYDAIGIGVDIGNVKKFIAKTDSLLDKRRGIFSDDDLRQNVENTIRQFDGDIIRKQTEISNTSKLGDVNKLRELNAELSSLNQQRNDYVKENVGDSGYYQNQLQRLEKVKETTQDLVIDEDKRALLLDDINRQINETNALLKVSQSVLDNIDKNYVAIDNATKLLNSRQSNFNFQMAMGAEKAANVVKELKLMNQIDDVELDIKINTENIENIKLELSENLDIKGNLERLLDSADDAIKESVATMPELGGRSILDSSPETIEDIISSRDDLRASQVQYLQLAKQLLEKNQGIVGIETKLIDAKRQLQQSEQQRLINTRNANIAEMVSGDKRNISARFRSGDIGTLNRRELDINVDLKEITKQIELIEYQINQKMGDTNSLNEQRSRLLLQADQLKDGLFEQSRELEDYFRNTARQVEDLKLQIEAQQLQDSRSIQDLSFQLLDASVSLRRNNRALTEAYQDMGQDFDLQIATIQKSIDDAQDQLELTQLRTENLSISPGNSGSIARQINDIFLRYTESLFSNESSERQIKIDILNLEKERIQRLRQIRDFEERQMDATRDFNRQIITLQRAFFDLELNMKNAARGFVRSIQDMVIAMNRADNSSPQARQLLGQAQGLPAYNSVLRLTAAPVQRQQYVPNGRQMATPLGRPIDSVPSDVNRRQSQPTQSFGAGDRGALDDIMQRFGGFPQNTTPQPLQRQNNAVQQLQSQANQGVMVALRLPPGYDSLQQLVNIASQSPLFNASTPQGAAALVINTVIGGTELLGKGKNLPVNQFATAKGGAGNIHTGYGQYNPKYHPQALGSLNNMLGYTGQILHGQRALPNSKGQDNFAMQLVNEIRSGMIRNGQDLIAFLNRGGASSLAGVKGGSNWEGLMNGWARVPGLADYLTQWLIKEIGQVNASLQGNDLALNFGVPESIELARTAQLGGLIQGAKNMFNSAKDKAGEFVETVIDGAGNFIEGVQNKKPKTLLELARKFARDNKDFLDGIDVVTASQQLVMGQFRVKSLQSGFNNLAKREGLAVPTSTPKPAKQTQALGSVQNGKIWAGEQWGWQSPAAYKKLLQRQKEGWQNSGLTTPGEVMMRSGKSAVQTPEVNVRNIGSQSILKGKPVFWAGEQWQWQSEDSYRKLSNNNFQKATPPTIKAKATITETTPTIYNQAGNVLPMPPQHEFVYHQQPQFVYQDSYQYPPYIESGGMAADYNPIGFYESNQSQSIGGYMMESTPVQDMSSHLAKVAHITDLSQKLIALRMDGVSEENLLIIAQANESYLQLFNTLSDGLESSRRSVHDTELSVNQLMRSSKGYLTITEKVGQAGRDSLAQYDGQIRSMSDSIRDLKRLTESKEMAKLKLAEGFKATGRSDQELRDAMTELDTTYKGYEFQILTLEAKKKELEATKGIAATNAQNRAYLQEQLNYIDKMVGLMGSISTARFDLGGTLVNEAPILQARMALATVDARSNREGEDIGLQGQALADYVAMSKELAQVNYQKSFREAIPFVKELGDNLKEAIFQTGNFGEAFSKVLDVMASQIFDRLVLIPFTTKTSKLIGELFGMGQQAIPTLANAGLSMGDKSVNNPSISDDGSVIFEPFTASMDTAIQSSTQLSQGLSGLATFTATQTVTEQSALTQFITALQVATQALYQFSISAGGGGQSNGGLFGSIIKGAAGLFTGGASSLASSFIPANVIGVDSSISIPTFADGLDNALTKETRRTGQKSMLAVINQGESVLSTLNGDAQKFQALKRSGQWDAISLADGTDKFYNQSRNYRGGWSNLVGTANRQQTQQTVNKFNQTYTIVTPNADSFRKSQSQIQDEGARTYRRKMR